MIIDNPITIKRGGNRTKRLLILAVLAIALIGMASAANYMYEKASVKGVGYKNVEMIMSTQTGFSGQKLVEKESGSATSSPRGRNLR
jgi:opacity protein-like surface antigen